MADPRFSRLSKDPRYRFSSRRDARTVVDPRFGSLFTNKDFQRKAKVDRYGRKIKAGSGKKELEGLYRLDDAKASAKGNQAQEVEEDAAEELDEDSDETGVRQRRDPAREGGFSQSSSEEEDSSDAESEGEDEEELANETAGQEQTEDIPMGDVSRRIAAVNLDWDNIRAVDIMVVASSFVPPGGRIVDVSIYPSEFGRERLEREQIEGPPKEIFASSKKNTREDSDEDDQDDSDNDDNDDDQYSDDDEGDDKIKQQLQQDQLGEGEDFDMTKLREYQLERLRYYYAVITCDTTSTGKALYDNMDGREYLSTANFFDLRFIPDEMSLDDDEPHEQCEQVPEGYRPNEFKTQALTHSKVRLTWDADDTTRKEVQKRAFSRAEIDENDLKAYIGSDSSDNDSTTSRKSAAGSKKAAKKEAQRAKLRAALGLDDEPSKPSRSKDAPVGDMQITFTSGLSGKTNGQSVLENEPQNDESTRDRYVRKERERKQKRKDKIKAARLGTDAAVADDEENNIGPDGRGEEEEDMGFNDPFFNDTAASAAAERQAKKADRKKKALAKAAFDEESKARRAELGLLMADDTADHQTRHFDMREIERAEKEARRKGSKYSDKKKKRSAAAQDEEENAHHTQRDDFEIQAQDPRFKALFDSHEFAIDPTNPRFKSTTAMRTLLEEGRKKRKLEDGSEPVEVVDVAQRRKRDNNNKLGRVR